jgi:hypothetical protein
MLDPKAKIEARYEVVTLLYQGKLEAAKLALDIYVKDGLITAQDESFYSQLLADALREKAGSSVKA